MTAKRLILIVFLLSIGTLGACKETGAKKKSKDQSAAAEAVKLEGKTAVLIIVPRNFQELEYNTIKKILEESKVAVLTAGETLDAAVGMEGNTVKPDLTWDKIDLGAIDALVYIGGSGVVDYMGNETLKKLARSAASVQKPLAAICLAPGILANADVLNGKKCTIFKGQAWRLTDKYNPDPSLRPAYDPMHPVIRDGWILTGNGPDAAEEFGHELVKMMAEKYAAQSGK